MSLVREPPLLGRSRAHSTGEQRADALVHAIGILAGIAGALFITRLSSDHPQKLAAISIYVSGLLAMLSASAAYNVGYNTRFRNLFRRFDHSAIFLMIAGTYTPFTTHFFEGITAFTITTLIWTLSLGGIWVKVYLPLVFERYSVLLYVALSWIALLVIGPLMVTMPTFTAMALLGGGVLYTGGITFHLWERLPYQNAIWHLFVLAAAFCHYAAVLNTVVLPA